MKRSAVARDAQRLLEKLAIKLIRRADLTHLEWGEVPYVADAEQGGVQLGISRYTKGCVRCHPTSMTPTAPLA